MMDRQRAAAALLHDHLKDRTALAGERMRVEHQPNGTSTWVFDDKGTGRRCGDCTLCCKLLPVPLFEKAANERCLHQSRKGCGIYSVRPWVCRTFACGWLADAECTGLLRPDRGHYVIDLTPDFITLNDPDTGTTMMKVGVIQVWVDPAFPEAHRERRLRAYMLHMARQYHLATLVRFNATKGLAIFPPQLATDHEWHELPHGTAESEHQLSEILAQRMTVELSDGTQRKV